MRRFSRVRRGLLAALLLAAVVGVLPGAPAVHAQEVTKQGTLGEGYALVASDGGIFNYGDSEFFGSTGALSLNKPIVGMEYTPTGEGYWLVASDGGIFTFGDAVFYGSTGGMKLNQPIVGMAATPTGDGYWLVASDGGIFTFGDAEFFGSAGSLKLVKPIVGIAVHPSGQGYWLVAADGGIFTYGDPKVIQFHGSQGGKPLNKPIVDMAPTETGNGYYMVATDGGLFTFGDATFRGSQGGKPLNQPINGMTLTPSGEGYWMVASDGGIFTFGDAAFLGSRGGAPLNKPVVGMAATPFSPVTAPDFIVSLEGENEVAPGDPDGSGFAQLDFTDDELCWYLQVDKVEPVTAAHIHEAPAGVNGDIVFTFDKPDADGTSVGCKAISKELSAAIMGDPERYYVNVHSDAYPNGAVRGQLQDELVVAATSDDKWVAFFASTPETIVLGPIAFSGHGDGENVVALDFRPATGDMYVLTVDGANVGRVYVAKDIDGKLTRVGDATDNITLVGSNFGLDINPSVDLIRIVSDGEDNFRVDPDDGTVTDDPDINPDSDVTGVAYNNNEADASVTTLYGVDSVDDTLVTINPANAGTVTAVGPLGIDIEAANGFDIAAGPEGEQNTALLVSKVGGTSSDVYAVNTAATATTRTFKLGTVGDGTLVITAVAIA